MNYNYSKNVQFPLQHNPRYPILDENYIFQHKNRIDVE